MPFATSAPGLRSPLATSASGLGSSSATSASGLGSPLATSAPGPGYALCHICTGTALTPCHICVGTGLILCHICTGTSLTRGLSAPGLGSPLPHRHRDWSHPSHIGNVLACLELERVRLLTCLAAHLGRRGCMPMMLVGLRRAQCLVSVCCAGRSGGSSHIGAPHTAEQCRTHAHTARVRHSVRPSALCCCRAAPAHSPPHHDADSGMNP